MIWARETGAAGIAQVNSVVSLGCALYLAADAVAERKAPAGGDPAELVLDGGFVVPDANAFGNTFR